LEAANEQLGRQAVCPKAELKVGLYVHAVRDTAAWTAWPGSLTRAEASNEQLGRQAVCAKADLQVGLYVHAVRDTATWTA